ncbi:hypothetical protein GKIL_1874 [Gloeobacter kilaueensis JS1]|uniref:Photosystem I reaction center subunit VIII n=1 Tax=Gloeobacter kilaueensis (strain ATCC BAA-2537 / CCAP 1431/1 / ULC 316 / JS1) TaxID=1183438 RepID=U5QK99_GLOK1|nr:hypothetical protein GKIL_1874 [Gloeobacter kilaueensis JS1]
MQYNVIPPLVIIVGLVVPFMAFAALLFIIERDPT